MSSLLCPPIPLYPLLDYLRNLLIGFLQERGMSISMYTDFPKLDPIYRDPSLPQVVDHAFVVRDRRRRLPRQGHIWHLGDLRQLACWVYLIEAGSQSGCIGFIIQLLQICWCIRRRIVCDLCVGKSPGTRRRPAHSAGGIAGIRLEGYCCRLDIDVASHQLRALIRQEDGVNAPIEWLMR